MDESFGTGFHAVVMLPACYRSDRVGSPRLNSNPARAAKTCSRFFALNCGILLSCSGVRQRSCHTLVRPTCSRSPATLGLRMFTRNVSAFGWWKHRSLSSSKSRCANVREMASENSRANVLHSSAFAFLLLPAGFSVLGAVSGLRIGDIGARWKSVSVSPFSQLRVKGRATLEDILQSALQLSPDGSYYFFVQGLRLRIHENGLRA